MPWPTDERGLVSEDGFFNKLTEDQAHQLSDQLLNYLPRLAVSDPTSTTADVIST